jgi:hypothetical protein
LGAGAAKGSASAARILESGGPAPPERFRSKIAEGCGPWSMVAELGAGLTQGLLVRQILVDGCVP